MYKRIQLICRFYFYRQNSRPWSENKRSKFGLNLLFKFWNWINIYLDMYVIRNVRWDMRKGFSNESLRPRWLKINLFEHRRCSLNSTLTTHSHTYAWYDMSVCATLIEVRSNRPITIQHVHWHRTEFIHCWNF